MTLRSVSRPWGRARGRSARRPVVVLVILAAALLTACSGSGSGSGGASSPTTMTAAIQLSSPIAEPALTLTDTSGSAYDLRSRTAGGLTLLYFGYTHCPDVCPTTMADIALALRSLPAVASRTTVVFVTTDPDRDTAPVIKAWLAHFNSDFVGLTGSEKTIYAAADKVGVPLEPPVRQADGTYTVTHGAQVIAFGPTGQARYAFTADAGSAGYIHDLPLIAGIKA